MTQPRYEVSYAPLAIDDLRGHPPLHRPRDGGDSPSESHVPSFQASVTSRLHAPSTDSTPERPLAGMVAPICQQATHHVFRIVKMEEERIGPVGTECLGRNVPRVPINSKSIERTGHGFQRTV